MSRRATGRGPSARGRRRTTKTEAAPSGDSGSSLTEHKSRPCMGFDAWYVSHWPEPDYLLCSWRCEDGVDGSDAPQAGEQGFLMDAQHRSRNPDNHNHNHCEASRPFSLLKPKPQVQQLKFVKFKLITSTLVFFSPTIAGDCCADLKLLRFAAL